MHRHAFSDTNVSLWSSSPELLYRSRGPPLSLLLNSNLLARSRNIFTELQKDYPKHEIINALVPISLKEDTLGFVASCGFNHTELEVVCAGAQRCTEHACEKSTDLNELDQCFKDIFSLESPGLYSANFQPQEAATRAKAAVNYDAFLKFQRDTQGDNKVYRKLFRFNRLAILRPQAFGTDRIAEIRVDDKMIDDAFIYARNANGCCVSRLCVKSFERERHLNKTEVSLDSGYSDYFPSITPTVVADMPFSLNNAMTNMFVSPYEFGVWAATTKRNQLLVWDSTISGPCSKINLFKSTEKHLSSGEMYNKWHGCVAGDVLECGTFADRHDSILLGGSKIYFADLRSRKIGYMFPCSNDRPSSSYRFPKLSTRLPVADRFLAIEKHPKSSSLYAMVSAVSSSVLLWDMRYPSQVITELPLPLLRQGRSRFRSLQWYPIVAPSGLNDGNNLWLLTSFCWDYDCAVVNALSVIDSHCVSHDTASRNQALLNHLENKSSFLMVSDPYLTRKREKDKARNNEFRTPHSLNEKSKHSAFFVNPFLLYPSPTRSLLPVCDPGGLCFSSSRPPIQIVFYHQIHASIGNASIQSEKRYFSPLGPILTCSETLINEGLHTSLNETPLSQLFHGLAGVTVIQFDVPNKTCNEMQTTTVLIALTFSGRIICSKLNLQCHKRKIMFPNQSLSQNASTENILQKFVASLQFPTSQRSKNPGLFPHFAPISSQLAEKSNCTVNNGGEPLTVDSPKWGPRWTPFPTSFLLDSREWFDYKINLFFPESLDTYINKYRLRGLHELLQPNEDSLDHCTFVISPKVNFSRLRLETILFWRHPDLNAVFYAEALLHMLLNPIKMHHLKEDDELPLKLPTIVTGTINNQCLTSKEKPACWSSVKEVIDSIVDSNSNIHSAMTLAELFSRCSNTVSQEQILSSLESKINEQKIICWFASTAGVDHISVEFLPIRACTKTVKWRGLAERIALPLCSCEAFHKKKPLRLNADQVLFASPLIAWSPHSESLIYKNYIRCMAEMNALQPWEEIISKPQKTKTHYKFQKNTLRRLARFLFSENLPVALYVENENNVFHDLKQTTLPLCNFSKTSSPFCSLPHFIIVQSNPLLRKIATDAEPVIQGRKFISTSFENLMRGSKREQEFILKHSPRDYPAYYAFLVGIRVTERLYHNLQKLWPVQIIHSCSLSCLIPSCSKNDDICCVSSFTNLLKFASTGVTEATYEEVKNNQVALGALTSQMKQHSFSRHRVADNNNSALSTCLISSQNLSATLEHLSQEHTLSASPMSTVTEKNY